MENQNNTIEQGATASGINPQQKKWIIVGLVVVVLLYLLKSMLFSPENIAERMIENATDGEYDISIDNDGNYTATSEDGESVNVSTGSSAKIPESWPASVPIPSGVNIEYAAEIAGQGSESVLNLTYTTSDSMQRVTDLYKNQLADNGWTIEAQVATGDGSMLSATAGENEALTLYVSESDGKTSVTISVQAMN